MLEPTNEMVKLVKNLDLADSCTEQEIRRTLTALLAIVKRDNQVHPLCTATLGTDMRCEYEAGMAHPNEHSAKAPSGSRVRWS